MKDWKLIMMGCAIGTVCSTTTAWLVTSHPVEAQAQGQFTQCIIARQESLDTNDRGEIEAPHVDRVVNIPPGWVPVGGGGFRGDGADSAVVLCRR